MDRVYDNWSRLIRATLKSEQLRNAGKGHGQKPSGLTGAIPPSLGRATNIDAILQAADEIQSEDPNVSRILCEQAYSMAHNLDPNSDGRDVIQFKVGLMSVIKQKFARGDGAPLDRNRDFESLWKFYHLYKRQHRVDDIQREEHKWRESGTFFSSVDEILNMRKVFATLRALIEVLGALRRDAGPEGVGKSIREELRLIKRADAILSAELTPYNIVPLESRSMINPIVVFPEVRGAKYTIKYTENFPRLPDDYEISGLRDADIFDLLEYIFGFQRDNVRNQREHLILTLANEQSRLNLPGQNDSKIDEKAINEVFLKVMENYIKWCKYLRIGLVYNNLEDINRDRKLFLVSLYFLIWGEAANVRFLPECICYIFHHMAEELDKILRLAVAAHAESCLTKGGSISFLEQVICPIYEAMEAEVAQNKSRKSAHSDWRNYDDFNEYFWSLACFKLGWPMNRESPFLMKPRGRKRTGKTNFVEYRTFLNLYRSFHRLWIFLAIMFQVLSIIAFRNEPPNLDTFKILLSAGPTYAIMNFIECFLDVVLMYGAYTMTRGMAKSRLIIRFICWGLGSVFVAYVYVKVLQERYNRNSNGLYFRIYVLAQGSYAAVRLLFGLLAKLPACHALSEMSDQSFFRFFKWIYQERYFVGRGLFERISDYCWYVVVWILVLASKFTFAYFLQIKPLVKLIDTINELPSYRSSRHGLSPESFNHALTFVSLWAPVIAIYLMDIYIWYTLTSAIIGGVMGARARLGEIRSLEMVHKRFESFPEAFAKNLVSPAVKRVPFDRHASQDSQDTNTAYAAMFSPFWNEIIKSLREEDYISNREMELLSMPSNKGSLGLVQWPLFLLCSKISEVVDLAKECKETQEELWSLICEDEYMAYAVQECYYSVEKILNSVVDGEGRAWVQKIFQKISESIQEGSLVITLHLKKLQLVINRFTALAGLLIQNETPDLVKGAADSMLKFYEVVANEFLCDDLREQLETWDILVTARKEGHLFSRIEWPRDPDIKEQVKRLHLLLLVKEVGANIPKNLEARRRLEFFTNSLFMNMPLAKPVSEMMPFCVFTPYYDETVLYSSSELQSENEDGISILFYLQKIYPDEWKNFLERIGGAKSTGDEDLQESSIDALELRFWVSYRGQTLARTVRGMMYYRRALMLQSFLERRGLGVDDNSLTNSPRGFELSLEARAQADLKFTYVVSCQIYGEQKNDNKPQAADIALLLQRNEALRVAFIHSEESLANAGKKEFYSRLVKADVYGEDQEIYSIKLPGNPKLGEGKPENQNHAIIFSRGEAIQTIDMNQDNYLEEAIKMRNLLEEFNGKHGIRRPTILGVREHVFTGSVSSLASFMSDQETSFVTLGQRVLAYPLKVRMHYGHPDVFDRIFHITRGGISKASHVINISEDIFAGFNSTLRQGNITHHEYIQVGKGRDVGLNQIALFEGKVAGGNGEQVLSRDVYRLGQLLDFFRMLSFYFTTVGFYVCTMITVLTVYVFLYGSVYLAFSGSDREIAQARLSSNVALKAALNLQFLFQIGAFTAVPMIMCFILELGLRKAIFRFVTMQVFQLCSVFFTFSLGTRTHYFGRTILHGGAKYRATGRGFVVHHIKFAENYRLYSRSHFVKALEVALLLIVSTAYGHTDGRDVSSVLLTVSSWFLVVSWLFAPYIFNPSGFEWQKTFEDFDDWINWLMYKGGSGQKGDNSWETWWEEEQMHIQTLRGRILETILSLRFFIFQYGIVYKLSLTVKSKSLVLYGFSWIVLAVIVLLFKLFWYTPKKRSIKHRRKRLVLGCVQGLVALGIIASIGLVLALTPLSVADLFAAVLGFIATGWAILCMAITWKQLVRRLGLWETVREMSRVYDAGMGTIVFVPVAVLSWFPFVSKFQSRMLFSQAFSRGLEISLILAGNMANAEI